MFFRTLLIGVGVVFGDSSALFCRTVVVIVIRSHSPAGCFQITIFVCKKRVGCTISKNDRLGVAAVFCDRSRISLVLSSTQMKACRFSDSDQFNVLLEHR